MTVNTLTKLHEYLSFAIIVGKGKAPTVLASFIRNHISLKGYKNDLFSGEE
jgi:hypothetical protein